MTIDEIIDALRLNQGFFPTEAVIAAQNEREALTPILIDELTAITHDRSHTVYNDGDYFLHIYALFLLAYWQDQSAYPVIMDFFSHELVDHDDILGDIMTENTPAIIASVFDGDMSRIDAVIRNPKIDPFLRMSIFSTFFVLLDENIIPLETVKRAFQDWFHHFADADSYNVVLLSALVSDICDLQFKEMLPAIEKAFSDNLIDLTFIGLADVTNALSEPQAPRNLSDRHALMGDLVSEMGFWHCFEEGSDDTWHDFDTPPPSLENRVETFYAPPKVGRNEPCPCGSGKKFKKCCLQ